MSAPNAEVARPLLLIVDDDAAICSAYEQIFGAHGYDVVTAGSRSTALTTVDKVAGAIDVMVLDIGLTDADGAELAKEFFLLVGLCSLFFVRG